jgi:transcriptional regulator with XRE-family HTH domain
MANKHKVFKESAERMRKVRSVLGYTQDEMGRYFGVQRPSYFKYENGLSFPNPYALKVMADNFDISLDWFIANKGPMFFKEKPLPEQKEALDTVMKEVTGLFEDMARIPLLRHEVLSFYYKFKLEYPELVNPPGNKNPR